jgi:hypothetical protein
VSDRIFMSVTRVPWHCEHNIDKEKCLERHEPDARASGPDDGANTTGSDTTYRPSPDRAAGDSAASHHGGDNILNWYIQRGD